MSSRGASRKCEFVHPETEQRCRAWAMRGSDPPRCSAHRGDDGPPVGAPEGNQNRREHGFYSDPESELSTIDDVVADALRRQTELSEFIGRNLVDFKAEEVIKLFALHGQNASRCGRLLRDQKILGSDSGDLFELLDQVLDEIKEEQGVDL